MNEIRLRRYEFARQVDNLDCLRSTMVSLWAWVNFSKRRRYRDLQKSRRLPLVDVVGL